MCLGLHYYQVPGIQGRPYTEVMDIQGRPHREKVTVIREAAVVESTTEWLQTNRLKPQDINYSYL